MIKKIKNPFISKTYKLLARVKINPSLAQLLLEDFNPCNPRERKKHHQKLLVHSILEGHWNSETGECIKIEANTGYILDGQHRLWSIMESGQEVYTSVAIGIKRNRYSGWQGMSRTRGEQNAFALQRTRDQAKIDGAILNICNYWLRNNNPPDSQSLRWDDETLWNFYLEHQQAIDVVLEWGYNLKARGKGVRAACAKYLYVTSFSERATRFFTQLIGNGEEIKGGSSVLRLRNYLYNRIYKGNIRSGDYDFTQTWNAIREDNYKETGEELD